MYRVMIVDDEEPVLESFSYILGKGVPGFELCGVARSGPEAISLVPELRPDLVFMDIQMQGMDGIEAVSRIQKRHPDIVFILSTAYERFDIAQKAIPLGVFNYLVKPVSRKALEDEFARVRIQLDDAREKAAIQKQEALYAQRMREEETRRFLLGLAWTSPGEPEWREFARMFSIKGDQAAVMLLRTAPGTPEAEAERAYSDILKQLQYKCACVSTVLAGRMIVLFPEPDDPEGVGRRVEKALEAAGGIDCRFGMGRARHYSSLDESYREAFEQLRGFGGEEGASPKERRRAERELRGKVLYGDWDEAGRLYERFWTEAFVSSDFAAAKARMIAFYSRLMDALDDELKGRSDVDVDPAEEIASLGSVQAWQQWSSYMMDRLRFIIKENKAQYLPKPLGAAVNYIRENYAKPIQLSTVAERCAISQGYLSKLFSEYLNTTFIDYLNTLRIGEAAKLLRGGGKSVKEVSYLVGYADPNYFSRIFRRYLNVSPSELSKGGPGNED